MNGGGLMDPEMMKLAQEQLGRMPPEELLKMQQQIFRNPELIRMASEGMKSLRPEDVRFAAEQMKHLGPEQMAEMTSRMSQTSPAEIAAMREVKLSYEIQASESLKNQGNKLHRSGSYLEAAEKYLQVKSTLSGISSSEAANLHLACSLNLMSCYLKTGEYEKVLGEGAEVLKYDSNNLKAYYRRGQAYKGMGKLKLAVADLTKAAEIDPCDETVKDMLKNTKKILEEQGDEIQEEEEEDGKETIPTNGVKIEEITEEEAELFASRSKKKVGERSEGPVLPNDDIVSEMLNTLKTNPNMIRDMHSMMSQLSPEHIASMSGNEMNPEMVKLASDMVKQMSVDDMQKMMGMAESFQKHKASKGPRDSNQGGQPKSMSNREESLSRTPPIDRPSSSSSPLAIPNLTPEMQQQLQQQMNNPAMKEMITGMMKNMTPETIASMGEQMGLNLSPEVSSRGQQAMPNTINRGASGLQAGLPNLTPEMQEQLQRQMNDPAMKQMMTTMMKNMTPESMVSMSEQMGFKLSPEDASRLQQTMSQISPDDIDKLMRWASRAQKVVEHGKKAKNFVLGRSGLILAIVMLLIAMFLHYLGYIGG